MGRILLSIAIASAIVAIGSYGLYEADAIDADTDADIALGTLAATAAVVVVGFVGRRRIRLAREAMFVGLATLGGWVLLFFYAFSQDTP